MRLVIAAGLFVFSLGLENCNPVWFSVKNSSQALVLNTYANQLRSRSQQREKYSSLTDTVTTASLNTTPREAFYESSPILQVRNSINRNFGLLNANFFLEFLSLQVPHALALIESMDRLCVADRENMRVTCPRAGLYSVQGKREPALTIQQPDMGRVFGIAARGK